ncbi:hypothetical protein [Phenylobacterium sp.]|uniref:hypothetical protein n=1 Tax=Phenylobacterium sp. TaxID=1871053 RepID=UPI003BAC9050
MKLIALFAVAAALTAGPALAQGTFNNGRKPATGFGAPSFSAPSYGVEAHQPQSGGARTYGTPPSAGGGFKPYEPYKSSSVYASPKPSTSGAKPCETSVYVNACDKRR